MRVILCFDSIRRPARRLRLYGHTEDDSLWVPMGFMGNFLDGGPHISTDTCGDCGFSTCMNCAP